MASEELELRQQIAEAKAEEKTYEQFDEEQVIDGMNDYLKNVPTKLTSIPILSDAQPISQSTPKVPSVKFQSSAIVSIISTTTSVNTSISVSASSMNPTAQPPDPRNLPIKEEEIEKTMGLPLIPSYIMTIRKDVCTFTERFQAFYQIKTILTFKGNRQNCQKLLLHSRPEVSHLAISRPCSLGMWFHTHLSQQPLKFSQNLR